MRDLTDLDDALAALLGKVTPLGSETVQTTEAGGRVLAYPVEASLDVPPFDSSAMDGYALRARDSGRWLQVTQRLAAGDEPKPLAPGECVRIFTGAKLPPGADCVVMQESVTFERKHVLIPRAPALNNVRCKGRDVARGGCLLEAGTRLEAAALGHLAGQGITEVEVRRRPRVALLSTGDEIVEPGTALALGQIYNSNRPMLKHLLERFGAEVVMVATVPDDPAATRTLLNEAAEQAEVVVTTGGVSVGEEDHVKAAIEALGELTLWRLAIRPGKPLALGVIPTAVGESQVVGLPGNPVSGYVGAWLFLRPLMGRLLGCPALARLPALTATARFDASTGPRTHYMRVSLEFTAGGIMAWAFDDQNSGVLSSCVSANALAVIPSDHQLTQGDRVHCLWLEV